MAQTKVIIDSSSLTELTELETLTIEKENNKEEPTSLKETFATTIEDLELPHTVVYRIAKEGLPENVKFIKDAKLALIKSSTVFINYIAACAQDIALQKKRKMINADDVLQALETLEFNAFVPFLKEYLEELKTQQSAKKLNKGE